jgi:5-methylcytosine-specific restriction endonuclease McrA
MSPRRERIYERDGYRCVECGTDENLTLDHRIPKSRGGSNEDSNLQTMCAACNQAKADSMPADLVGSVYRISPVLKSSGEAT